MDDLDRYLDLLMGGEDVEGFLEVRYRRRVGMGQRFIPATDPEVAADLIRRLGTTTDTYVGVALRDRRAGGRDAVGRSRLVFVEVDAAASTRLLERAPAAPSMTVASGTPGHLHAYWQLRSPARGSEVKAANRKLAHRVGGDLASTDESRILRPPQTLNFKHTPPQPVVLESLDPDRAYDLEALIRGLEDPSTAGDLRRPRRTPTPWRRSVADPSGVDGALRAIPTAEYIARLTGLVPNREGKLSCPWHEDRTPSLHCYANGEWCCFGCRRGGTIYDFAANLWPEEGTKGRAFVRLRVRLADAFGVTPPVLPRRASCRGQAASSGMAVGDRERVTTTVVNEKGGR